LWYLFAGAKIGKMGFVFEGNAGQKKREKIALLPL
jgi:hypothetical protein